MSAGRRFAFTPRVGFESICPQAIAKFMIWWRSLRALLALSGAVLLNPSNQRLTSAGVMRSRVPDLVDAIRQLGISEVTFYRWRKEYGGMSGDRLRRLKELEKENERLRRAVSDLTLDRQSFLQVLLLAKELKLLRVGLVIRRSCSSCTRNAPSAARLASISAKAGIRAADLACRRRPLHHFYAAATGPPGRSAWCIIGQSLTDLAYSTMSVGHTLGIRLNL